ncbi:MAG: hypothetical protein K6G26_12565 [Lachnospiraceae bacterium]|nr:hypothetical protein [Lachnospiraceae bacterium]
MMEEKDRPLLIYVITILGVMFCILGIYLLAGGGKTDKNKDKGNSIAKNDTGYSTEIVSINDGDSPLSVEPDFNFTRDNSNMTEEIIPTEEPAGEDITDLVNIDDEDIAASGELQGNEGDNSDSVDIADSGITDNNTSNAKSETVKSDTKKTDSSTSKSNTNSGNSSSKNSSNSDSGTSKSTTTTKKTSDSSSKSSSGGTGTTKKETDNDIVYNDTYTKRY